MHAPQKLIPLFPNVPWMVHFNHSYNQTTPELARWIDLEMTCSKIDWLSEEIIFTRFSIWVRLLEESDWQWPLPMYTMLKKLSNITLINDSKTLGAHFESFFGGTDEAHVTLGLPLPCRPIFAVPLAHIRQGHCACILVSRKRPGLKSLNTFKTFLK